VAGVALGDIRLPFAWQAWHWRHWAGSGGPLGPDWSRGDAAALCVAGVALGDIQRHFAWQAWHLETSNGTLRGRRGTQLCYTELVTQLCHTQKTFTCVLRGRRGAYGTGWRAWTGLVADDAAALCVAGVALGDTLRGRHGTW